MLPGRMRSSEWSHLQEIEKEQVKIKKAYLLSCVNGRLGDFAEAAEVVKGKKVNPRVEFYIAPSSAAVQKEAERLGYWQALLDAGAFALPAGCGPCIGLGIGTLEAGEVGISARTGISKAGWGIPTPGFISAVLPSSPLPL